MKSRFITALAVTVALAIAGVSAIAAAGGDARTEISVLGGFQTLNQNDTALPDDFFNVPAVAAVTYHVTPNWAAEGEFTWLIPVKQSVDMGSGASQDLKSPDVLAYLANVRGSLPLSQWTPYLTAGLGAMTFLSSTGADRVPQLQDSQTAFAIDFGGGVSYGLTPHWGLRADYRQLAAFPGNDAAGLSTSGNADAIWMERVTVGVGYRF